MMADLYAFLVEEMELRLCEISSLLLWGLMLTDLAEIDALY